MLCCADGDAEGGLRASKAACATRFALLTPLLLPSSPPGKTLLILLLAIIPRTLLQDDSSISLPTTTGEPGKAFLVNMAAQAAVPLGSSKDNIVSVMAASSVGSSRGEKENVRVAVENPSGSCAFASRKS